MQVRNLDPTHASLFGHNRDHVSAFIAIYGSPFEDFYLPHNLPRRLTEGKDLALAGKPPLSLDLFKFTQEAVRRRWRGAVAGQRMDIETPFVMTSDPGQGGYAVAPSTISVVAFTGNVAGSLVVSSDGIEVVVADVWSYIKLAVAHDSAMGKLHVCANPKCSTPYFKEQRRGQTFCKHQCAVQASYDRFRAKQKATKKKKRGK